MKDIPLEETNLSYSMTNCLKRNGIFYLSQLMKLNRTDITNMKGVGQKKAKEIMKLQQEVSEQDQNNEKKDSQSNDMRIEEIGLSIRAINCLKRKKILYKSQFMKLTRTDVMKIRNAGLTTVNEIMDLQHKIGLQEGFFSEEEHQIGQFHVQPELVLHIAIPKTRGKNIGNICFEDRNGHYSINTKVEDVNFSVRLSHCLARNNIVYISDVANMEYEKVSHFHNIGQKSLEELIEYLRNHTKISELESNIAESDAEKNIGEILQCMKARMIAEEKDFPIKDITPYLTNSIVVWLHENTDSSFTEKLNDINETENLCKQILRESQEIVQFFKDYILSIIGSNTDYFCLSDITDMIPRIIIDCGVFDKTIAALVRENILEENHDCYRRFLPTNEMWIDSLKKDNQKKAVRLRLEGKTLEECGQILGVTRERIRQITHKAFSKKIQTREDDYKYWYEKYALDFEAMDDIFEIERKTYNYLKIMYKSGCCDVEEMENDVKITPQIYKNWKKYICRDSVWIGERLVPCKREILCRELAKEYCSERDFTYKEFYESYMQFLKDNNLDQDESLLFPSDRAFEARISDSRYVLSKYGRKFRYYPIIEYDICELIKRIRLEQFENIEISTLKIFNENRELMEEYNIIDEYELHNLLKKTENIWNKNKLYDVTLTRMPFIAFGHVDRKQQTIDFLYQIAPVTLEEFAQLYEMEYGVLSATVMANMFQYVSNYYYNGMFLTDQPLFDDSEKRIMESVLKEDFYFIEDIKKVFIEYFGTERLEHLNARTIKELGYKVYSKYAIRNTYQTADSYFTYLYTKDNIIDLNDYDSRLIYIQTSNQALDTLRTNRDLIEFEENKYIKFNYFTSTNPDISKDDLEKYVYDAINYSAKDEFFTIKSLQKRGFESELHHLDLSDWFYAALLKNSKKIRYVKVGGGILFFNGEKRITTTDFLRIIVGEVRKINIGSLCEYILKNYGLQIHKDKVRQLIYNSEMYYDAITETVYLSKDYYYEV